MYRHLKCPDRQVFFHSVAHCPTDNSSTEQVNDDSQIAPAFGGLDVADVTRPFLVRRSGQKIAIQQVRRHSKAMLAVSGNLVPMQIPSSSSLRRSS